MLRHWFKVILPPALLFMGIMAALFADFSHWGDAPMALRTISREVLAACRDPGTQWMVVLCLLSYFVTFLVLERRLPRRGTKGTKPGAETEVPFAPFVPFRGKVDHPDFWLMGFVVLVLLRYAVDYASAAKSLQVVVLLAGIVMGKGVALWVRWGASASELSTSNIQHPTSREAAAPSPFNRIQVVLCGLVLLLAGAALWQPEMGMDFQYRGVRRWEGVWDNPNIYGLLMGVGAILAVGLFVQSPPSKVQRPLRVLLLVAVGLCGFGLLKSYSRGAWLGTACGLALLVWSWINRTHLTQNPHPQPQPVGEGGVGLSTRPTGGAGESSLRRSWLRDNWLPLLLLLVSSFVISFWQFRHTESPLLRRVFSVGNVNDFSWRNRVTAWQGAARMIADKPLAGFGWGKAEEAFRKEYRAERLEETAAVQVNDYLMLGISAGLPALLCLVIYISLVGWQVSRAARGGFSEPSTLNFQLSTTALAGALVLLIGFWFDGGLFKLPTGVVFWILLELARAPFPSLSPSEGERLAVRPGEGNSLLKEASGHWPLRWLAAIVTAAAIGQTAFHLALPQFTASERTLALARKWLVPAREQADFEFLAANEIWSGRPLRVLLQHAHLANYNRELVNWKVDDSIYQQFVLSPQIEPALDGEMNWRRPLWEYFYPRIRKEGSLTGAVEIVGRHLHERVRIAPESPPKSIAEIWRQARADDAGFGAICIAALRSVGIPARFSELGQAEYWNGSEWKSAKGNPAR